MKQDTSYNPTAIEGKWYHHWLQQGLFRARPTADKTPYTVVMPPPNVTGILHMGHVLNNTLQDVLIRKARMEGKEACWVPGLDHASIATEAKVVAMLQEQGMSKSDLTREDFLKHAWAWKEQYGGIILQQLKRLGISCDWGRTRFTLDQDISEAVQQVFIRLYQEGYIYRDTRMIHWDPAGQTALSDDEVMYKEVEGALHYLRYALVGSNKSVTIATTRPETILGDTALCVHPDDTRYQHLHGKQALVPIIQKAIPIIADPYVDPSFGTGCLKVTPAHDRNDYELGRRHGLAVCNILQPDGTLNEQGQPYTGQDRFAVREQVIQHLKEHGHWVKTLPYRHKVGFSERTQAVVEPRISTQWFVKMKDLAAPALQHVLDGTIRFYPAQLQNRYKTWLAEVQDWCISRQLWWGHRIPAYYLPDGKTFVAANVAEALAQARQATGNIGLQETDLEQDADVLDTWFSSWLWPMAVFDGITAPQNADMQYFYPTQVLVTAPEIIFFWVARMIMAGYHFHPSALSATPGQSKVTTPPPFQHVYFTGIVRDKLGRKMSKSLGNSPDPIALMDQYGADGVRLGMLLSAPAGNDLLFDVKLCKQGRNFANKLWHAHRLLQGWQMDEDCTDDHSVVTQWFDARLQQTLQEIEVLFTQFRLSDVLMKLYKLVWDDFCSWYLELIKPAQGQLITPRVHAATCVFFETLLKLLHPFMPFITEELWQRLASRKPNASLMVEAWPQATSYKADTISQATMAFDLITHIRHLRRQEGVVAKQVLPLILDSKLLPWWKAFGPYVQRMAHVMLSHEVQPALQRLAFHLHHYTFTLCVASKSIEQGQTREELTKELAYVEGFLQQVQRKLDNERFLKHAPPEVIAREQQKQADALAKMQLLQERLAAIG